MTLQKRGLSRGLDSLLSDYTKNVITDTAIATQQAVPTVATPSTSTSHPNLATLPVSQLQAGRYQPRTDFPVESLQELADSIKAQGLIQPIIVRKVVGDNYEIIAGERRWRAAQMVGLTEVPVVIRDLNDQAAMAMALIENIQREDLNPLEEAKALHRLSEEFGLTQQQVADSVGRSRVAVANLLRLLKLNPDVKTLLENGDLEMGHARALLGLDGQMQSNVARTVVDRGLTVRETEQLIRRTVQTSVAPAEPRKTSVDPDVLRLQDNLSEALGAKVKIFHGGKGNGKIEITYHSLDELDGIIEHMSKR